MTADIADPAASQHLPRVYLAGPDVFLPDCAARFESLRASCSACGLVGVPPSDGDFGADASDDERAARIYEGNIALIRSADGVIANLANFRGQEPDSGTVFEVGFAIALGKPVVAYGVPEGSYAERVAAAIPCRADAAGITRERVSGLMVEGLGQRLNLMLARSVAIEPTAEAALSRLAARLQSSSSPSTCSST